MDGLFHPQTDLRQHVRNFLEREMFVMHVAWPNVDRWHRDDNEAGVLQRPGQVLQKQHLILDWQVLDHFNRQHAVERLLEFRAALQLAQIQAMKSGFFDKKSREPDGPLRIIKADDAVTGIDKFARHKAIPAAGIQQSRTRRSTCVGGCGNQRQHRADVADVIHRERAVIVQQPMLGQSIPFAIIFLRIILPVHRVTFSLFEYQCQLLRKPALAGKPRYSDSTL